MPHHFSKNTVEASVWCKVCGKATPHRIDDGRRGPCIPCMNKPIAPEKPKPATQKSMFGE